MSKKSEYTAKMETQLEKLNEKIKHLETSAQEEKEEARLNYKEEMGKLRKQSKVAATKLEELKESSEDSWETMINDMEQMHDAFAHSFFSFFQVPTMSESDAADDKAAKAKTAHSPASKKA